jgi:hypothetical protein
MTRPNKLECLYLTITFKSSLIFVGNTRSLPKKEASERCPIVLALALPSNSQTGLEKVSKDKPSSLLDLVISDEGKKFYNIDTSLPCCVTKEENKKFIVRFSECRVRCEIVVHSKGCHFTQHNDIQYNDTHHKNEALSPSK